MESLTISFVLPCYNVERYITDCLNSIYAQDLPEDRYELICVNDCSTDGTRAVIVDFAKNHSNLTLIDHEQNLTAGGARNTGIAAAKGEFIWFVDPDDIIKSNCLSELCAIARNANPDILMFNFSVVDEHCQFIREDKTFIDSEICDGQRFITHYFPNRYSELCIVWRCLFRTGFLKEKALLFPIMRKAQDVAFLWKVLLDAESVISIAKTFYIYRNNPYSVAKMRSVSKIIFSERILFANEICLMLENRNLTIDKLIREDMKKTLLWCANSNLACLQQMSDEARKNYYNEIIVHKDAVANVKPYMNRKQKHLFSVFGGKRAWLFKVRLLCLWEKCRKGKSV